MIVLDYTSNKVTILLYLLNPSTPRYRRKVIIINNNKIYLSELPSTRASETIVKLSIYKRISATLNKR